MKTSNSIRWYIIFAIIIASLVSCKIEDTKVGATAYNTSSPISINNTGVVPLLSDSTTNGIIYIHNNSDSTINGITYTIKNNDQTPNNFSVSRMQCNTIAAHSRCALSFTIGTLADTVAQSSAIITANLTNNYKFSQIINYAKVFNNTSQGIFINSDVILANFGNSTSYATVYAYGGAGGSYTLTNFLVDNPQITIDNSDFGKVLANNEIIAIEVSTTASNVVTNLNINAINTTNSSTYSTKIGISTTASSDGAILTSGYSPIVNTSSTTTGSFAIVNSGNATATFGTITYPTGTSSNASTTCGSTLAAQASCTIYFTITASTDSSGSISIPYTGGTGGTLTQTVTWYNSKGGGALAQMVSSSSSMYMLILLLPRQR